MASASAWVSLPSLTAWSRRCFSAARRSVFAVPWSSAWILSSAAFTLAWSTPSSLASFSASSFSFASRAASRSAWLLPLPAPADAEAEPDGLGDGSAKATFGPASTRASRPPAPATPMPASVTLRRVRVIVMPPNRWVCPGLSGANLSGGCAEVMNLEVGVEGGRVDDLGNRDLAIAVGLHHFGADVVRLEYAALDVLGP